MSSEIQTNFVSNLFSEKKRKEKKENLEILCFPHFNKFVHKYFPSVYNIHEKKENLKISFNLVFIKEKLKHQDEGLSYLGA